MNIAEKADRLFAARGIKSQAEFAKSIGIGEVTLYNTFRKGSEPRVHTALAIARGLGVSVEWLFDDAADWPPPDALEAQRPPLPIAPWPPHGITWPEVQRAISEYVMRRADDAASRSGEGVRKLISVRDEIVSRLEAQQGEVTPRPDLKKGMTANEALEYLVYHLNAMADSSQQQPKARRQEKKAARKA